MREESPKNHELSLALRGRSCMQSEQLKTSARARERGSSLARASARRRRAGALPAPHRRPPAAIVPPGLATARLALCWPIKGEYDGRHLARTLRERGALTALPVVVAPKQPLIFREWHPGTELATGPLDIPYPANSPEVVPNAVLLPMITAGTRPATGSAMGGGFFDRTLANLPKKPAVIGVTYELAKMDTIHPQSWDIRWTGSSPSAACTAGTATSWRFSANRRRESRASWPRASATRTKSRRGYFGEK